MNHKIREEWVIALLLAGTFLLAHSYIGIRHDGSLYIGEALFHLYPDRFKNDLFFAYGSQSSYSILPWIYAEMVRLFGIGDSTKGMLLFAYAMQYFAGWYVLTALVQKPIRYWCLLAVCIGLSVYGGHKTFAYSEAFFTARSLAEPLALIAIGLMLRRQVLFAILVCSGAALLHPLIALPAFAIIWVWVALSEPRWWFAVGLGVIPLGLAFLGIDPFSGLFLSYDPEWLGIIKDVTPTVFPLTWSVSDWAGVAFDIAVLGFVIAMGTAEIRRIAYSTVIVCCGGIILAILFADLGKNVLLTGLQIWRVQWIAHWLAMALLPWVVYELWKSGSNHRATAVMLIASTFSLQTFAPLVLIAGAIGFIRLKKYYLVRKNILWLLMAFAGATLFISLGKQLPVFLQYFEQLEGSMFMQVARVVSMTTVLVILMSLALWFWPRHSLLGLLGALMFFVFAVSNWDQRERWTRYQENYSETTGQLWDKEVSAKASVYWYRDILAPWLLMNHGNYYAPHQAGGALFNRETAIQTGKRARMTALLDFQEMVCRAMNTLNEDETSCEPDVEAVKTICESAGSELDFIVLQTRLARGQVGVFRTGITEHGYEKTYYLYRCADIVAG